MTPEQLKCIFAFMFDRIGREKNPDVDWYLNRRPDTINRDSFFRATVWAIWVSGLSRVAADSFLARAEAAGFDWDYRTFSSWDALKMSNFVSCLHRVWTFSRGRPRYRPLPERARQKWQAVKQVAKLIGQCPDEGTLRKEFFGAKTRSATLDKTDIRRLVDRRISFVREANAAFIIRNMGGEAVKCDRWVEKFLSHHRLSLRNLEIILKQAQIPLGLFDIVLWAYCERFVRETSYFDEHFDDACA